MVRLYFYSSYENGKLHQCACTANKSNAAKVERTSMRGMCAEDLCATEGRFAWVWVRVLVLA